VEQRVASGGEVRGRLDGLTPRLVLELACRAQRDVRVSIRDSSYLYEVQVRAGAPRTAIRSANDGSFERGEGVLSMLLGVSAGRFVVQPDDAPCRPELTGSLHEQLAGPVARARAAQRALSAGALTTVTRVAFDAGRVGGYLQCTPEPAQSLLRELMAGASPRDLLTSGRAPARLLEAVLSDFARRGGILLVETATGVEDISQTRVPPTVAPPLAALSLPEPEAEPTATPAGAAPVIVAPEPDAPPVSQRKPPAIYSQPPDAELASADEGWFSFQIEASAPPPEAAAAEPAPVLRRSEDPLRKTLNSTAPPAAENEAAPGASVLVERGIRPELRANTLGSAGNEAAAALAAVAAEPETPAVSVVEPAPSSQASPPRPVAKAPRPTSPMTPRVIEDDPLAYALSAGTPSPIAVAPVVEVKAPLPPPTPPLQAAAAPPLAVGASTQVMEAVTVPASSPPLASAVEAEPPARKRSDIVTEPPGSVAKQAAAMQVPKAAPKAQPGAKPTPAASADAAEGGGWGRTVLFAAVAAGASYFGVTALFGSRPATAPAEVAPVVPQTVPSVAPAAVNKPLVTTSESPLPPGIDVPPGNGLLEVQVQDGTAIRVDGEYLGMGPSRRVPLPPGEHQLTLGDAPAQMVTIKLGLRTLAVAPGSASAPAGSP
jgi:hypothetical protein